MRVSLVWTASFLTVVILLASGCAERRVVRLQPLQPATGASGPPPVSEIHAPAPAALAPVSASIPKPNRSTSAARPPAKIALNAAPAKPASSNPAKSRETVVKEAPPPPQVEVVGMAPGADYAWIPGSWRWRDRWVWEAGYWALKPRPDAEWAKGHWTKRDRGWVWVRGYWR